MRVLGTHVNTPGADPSLPMLQHALWWAAKGCNVLPLHWPVDGACSCGHTECQNVGKHPLPDLVRHGLSDATTDPDTIRVWWTKYPLANIGVRTGEIFDVVDIDTGAGATKLSELAAELGGMPSNLGHARTGRDGAGMHIYVVPGGMKALQGSRTAPPGIDVKGRGGYVVVPPSLHETGRRYEFISSSGFATGETAGTVPWDRFYAALEVKPKQPPRSAAPTTHIPLDAANAYGRAVLARALELVRHTTKGNRWQTLATEAIPLVCRGIDGGCIDRDSAVRELEEAARDAGLDEAREVRRIARLVDDMLQAGIRQPIRPKDLPGSVTELTTITYDTEDEARSDPWEPPWPLRHPAPPFPVDILGWMAQPVRQLADQLQVPVDLVAMMTLAAVAATVRGRARAQIIDTWEEPLNLYIAVILGPGETKSPALRRIIAPLREIEQRARAAAKSLIAEREFTKDLLSERAKRARDKALKTEGNEYEVMNARNEAWRAQEEADAIEIPVQPLYLAGDMTPEALVAKLAEQGGALAHLSAEGELLDTIVGGRYSSGAPHISALLTAHDGREPIRVHRKKDDDIEVPHPCLTLGLAVQDQVIQQMGKVDAAVQRGLTARFLYSLPTSLVGRRDMTLKAGTGDVLEFHHLIEGVNRLLAGQGSEDIEDTIGQYGNAGRPQAGGSEDFEDTNRGLGNGSAAEGPDGQPVDNSLRGTPSRSRVNQGFEDIEDKSFKYGFLTSSLLLLLHYRELLEPRRAAETGDLGEVAGWVNKLDGQLVRLAAVLQIVYDTGLAHSTTPTTGSCPQNPHNPRLVGVEAMSAALVLGDYLIAHAVEAHRVMRAAGAGDGHERARQLLGWLRAKGLSEFTARDAQQSLRRRVMFDKPEHVQEACAELERLGWLRRLPPEPDQPGRPSVRYLVHPEALS